MNTANYCMCHILDIADSCVTVMFVSARNAKNKSSNFQKSSNGLGVLATATVFLFSKRRNVGEARSTDEVFVTFVLHAPTRAQRSWVMFFFSFQITPRDEKRELALARAVAKMHGLRRRMTTLTYVVGFCQMHFMTKP